MSPPTHHLSVFRLFLRNPSRVLPVSLLLLLTPWPHTLALNDPESVHISPCFCCDLALNTIRLPYSSIFSQSVREKAMPGGVGINLSPHHSCFLLLSACLIKLHHPPHPHPFNHTHTHTSPFLHHLLSIARARLPALSSSAALLNLAPFALFNLPASHSLCHYTHIHIYIYSSVPFFFMYMCVSACSCL